MPRYAAQHGIFGASLTCQRANAPTTSEVVSVTCSMRPPHYCDATKHAPPGVKKASALVSYSYKLYKAIENFTGPVTPPPEPSQSWERHQLKSQPQELITTPTKGSHASTVSSSHAGTPRAVSTATAEAADRDKYIDNGGDKYDRLDWGRLGRRYTKPLKQPSCRISWIYPTRLLRHAHGQDQ
jgi:hypothetical protein